MKWFGLILLVVGSFFVMMLSNCSTLGIPKPPSVCDNMEQGQSVLCDTANNNDIHLETVGNLVMVLNVDAIKNDRYSAEQAISVLGDIRAAINSDITAMGLKSIIIDYIDEYPELILLTPYFGYLDSPEILKAKDIEMLNAWIDQQIGYLSKKFGVIEFYNAPVAVYDGLVAP
jgi:hypothetical protein